MKGRKSGLVPETKCLSAPRYVKGWGLAPAQRSGMLLA
jgi:hypothetical protein